jgi:hypothetical protein
MHDFVGVERPFLGVERERMRADSCIDPSVPFMSDDALPHGRPEIGRSVADYYLAKHASLARGERCGERCRLARCADSTTHETR